MKKLLIIILGFILTIILSVLLVVNILQDRFIEAFKNQITDKTNLNISYSKIQFSLFKNFPYSSFILDDAQINYSNKIPNDTLISSKKLSFKINSINLFQSSYEFPEIIISDAIIILNVDKLDLLLSNQNKTNQNNSFLIQTKVIKLKRCTVRYNYKEKLKLNLYLDNSNCSGTFSSRALLLRLSLKVYSLKGCIDNYYFKSNHFIHITSLIKEKDSLFFSDNGMSIINSLPIQFKFYYSLKNDELKLSLASKSIGIKDFCSTFFNSLNIGMSKGLLSFNTNYDINFNNLNTQKLTAKYELKNVEFSKFKDLSLIKVTGITTIIGDLDNNSTDVTSFMIHSSGLDFIGSLKIKNLPQPYVLIDSRFKNNKKLNLIDSSTIYGNISGNIKSLIKLSNVNDLNFNTINILKFNSDISFSNLSIKNFDYLSNLEGKIIIENNHLHYKGNGRLFNVPFNGQISMPNFLEVISHKIRPLPTINLSLERLNLDSIPANILKNKNSSDSMNYFISANIDNVIYNNLLFNDLKLTLNKNNEVYKCNLFTLKAFTGMIKGNFDYSQQNGCKLSLSAYTLNIKNLFKGFNSFGQSVITHSNISGSLSGNVDLSFTQLNSGKINPLSINLVSDILVENGTLKGVSQLKKVYKFLNLDENDSIHFQTLQNKITIEQGLIIIPSMSVSSNAINFNLSGKHDFNGEFIYWIKLNLRDVLAKKFLLPKRNSSEYERDNKNGLNLFIKISGNNNSFNVNFDKKSTMERIKGNFNQEGVLLKKILNEEFIKSKNANFLHKDSITLIRLNKVDSIHNKNEKKSFRIEWDEIDSTKVK